VRVFRLFYLTWFVTLSYTSFAQKVDSASISSGLQCEIDSLFISKAYMIDTLQQLAQKELRSLKYQYDSIGFVFDSLSNKLLDQVDSLANLGNSVDHIFTKVDSLQQLKLKGLQQLGDKVDKLKDSAKEKINAVKCGLDLSPDAVGFLDEYTNSIDYFDIRLPGNYLEFPALEVEQFVDVALPGINNPFKLGQLELDGVKDVFDRLNTPFQVSQDGFQLPSASDMSAQVEDQIADLATERIGEMLEIPSIPTEEEAKHKLLEQLEEMAIDHFAEKQDILKAAMDKLSQLKRKYPSLQSLEDLPKRAYNPWRDKSLLERLVPALTLQVQRKNDWWFDVNPMLGYHFNKRITTGLGWNHRFPIDLGNFSLNKRTLIFGVRGYNDFSLSRQCSIRTELECMNTPTFLRYKNDTAPRDWVWGFMVGLKKDYKISKLLRGNTQILYNVFNPHYNSPYIDRINIRMGIEYITRRQSAKGSH